VLGREADDTGLINYMEALSQGFGKDSILISLMNSDEARLLIGENKPCVASDNSDVLSRELAQLYEAHKKSRRAGRIFRSRRSGVKRTELNVIEFRLESMFLSMLSEVKSEILQEITHRLDFHHEVGLDFHHEVVKTAQNTSHTVNVIQAQRRSVSRPGREG